MNMLEENSIIDTYRVQNVIKRNEYTETYRVVDENNNVYFLKAYAIKRTPERLVNSESGEVYEIERGKELVHENIVSYIGSGKINTECGECQYFVTNYFTGDILLDKIQHEGIMQQEEALDIYKGILKGLKYLHEHRLSHNDITPRNIMLSKVAGGIPEIIDLGHTSPFCSGKVPFDVADLEILYSANETFMGVYDEQSDIFSATAVLYTMLTNKAPWEIEFSENMSRSRRFTLLKDKRKSEPLSFDNLPIDEHIKSIMAKGLAVKYENRYRTVEEILHDLINPGNSEIDAPTEKTQQKLNHIEDNPNATNFHIEKTHGNGFADIAGMQELKDLLNKKVIFVLKNKELANKYKLTPPNGMLLYGPPGCGKTFFAEKFAEETGFNFMMVKSSDLASIYVHGSQEKIGQLFKQAQQQAPSVICFDEFDALVPDRSAIGAEHQAGEVNEFLNQLNNCSKRGIFVIATSNRPDKIDAAVLRTGRIDKQVYVPLPDTEARKEMFLIHLKDRPYKENEIDTEKLSKLTDGYIASDIAYIVNDAAMTAAYTNQFITQELLETSLKNTSPSIKPETLKMYNEIKDRMEGIERRNLDRQHIGFV